MSIFLNPVVFSVILMCILCLCKLNVMFSLIIACFVGGLMGGMSVSDISSTMLAGFSNNAEAALAYILLGTFASCLAYTGLADIFAKRVAQAIRGSKLKLFLLILIFSIISQTIIPIHTAYIPILIPPMLAMMNEMKMDRRLMAGALVSGMMPYVGIPIGYGLIFMGIVKDNMCANGLTVTVQQVYSVNWMLMLTFIPGIIYIWFRYRKPREYKNVDVDLSAYNAVESTKLELRHWISIAAVLVIMFFSGAVKWKDIEERFNDGIRMMGSIAFIMLVAGGFGMVMRATGGVNALVERSASALSSSHLLAATVITLIGLVVTMGIGTSFGTIPVIAVLFVPLCTKLGFSPAATILMISSAAALGDAGSPASDATLGPTCGLNADGQHDHIWDTCVPTFGALNIPLMIGTIIIAQFI